MSAASNYWYADAETRARLTAPGDRVLLLGSCGGFANFGDVLQLKGALAWHRENTGLDPIVQFHVAAMPDAGYLERQRRAYGVRAILLWHPEPIDLSAGGLTPLNSTVYIPHLHVYGGGFLNRFWGRNTVAIIESLIERFGVGHYVMSGQQIDELFVPELREHFRRHAPLLAGGRDPASAKLLAACGVEAADSFDDAAEMLQLLACGVAAPDRDGCGAAAPGCFSDLLLHLNLSYYTGHDELDRMGDMLARLDAYLQERITGRAPRVTLLHAYNDRRVDEVIDTLGAVQYLEHRFPFTAFDVIDLSQVAMKLGVGPDAAVEPVFNRSNSRSVGPPCPTPNPDTPSDTEVRHYGSSPVVLPRAPLAVLSSYHISILLSLLGIPCHLVARNDYYTQKRDGLGLGGDLEMFLADENRKPLDLRERFARRGPWQARLREMYATAPARRDPVPPPRPSVVEKTWASGSRPLERRRRHIEELEAENRGLRQEAQVAEQQRRALADGFDERGRRVAELEAALQRATAESQRLWSEMQPLAQGFEERGQRVRELEETCKNLWEEARARSAASHATGPVTAE